MPKPSQRQNPDGSLDRNDSSSSSQANVLSPSILKAHLTTFLQSPLSDISQLKRSISNDSLDLGELFAGFKNMIDFQESNLPDASLVVEKNWNGILILAEFNNWLQNLGD